MSIFVIDQHPMMREAVASIIRRLRPSVTVFELDGFAAVAPAAAAHGAPELVCAEIVWQGSTQVFAVRELRQQFADIPLIVLTSAPEQAFEKLALDAGASAYVSKCASAVEISNVLRGYLIGEPGSAQAAPIEKLSKRQKQLLILIDKGMSNRDIAESLQISEHTVKVHLWRLFRRMNVKSRSQASHLARTQGLL